MVLEKREYTKREFVGYVTGLVNKRYNKKNNRKLKCM